MVKQTEELLPQNIQSLISDVVQGIAPEKDVRSFLVRVKQNGINRDALRTLTEALAFSGKVLTWPNDYITADVASTGGVGNKTPVIAASMLAALGFWVPKISGRALRHTGGTIDILESIPGFNAELPFEEFKGLVHKYRYAVTTQTSDLAPGDGKLYALRRITDTADSIPLIASSIISKKVAMGIRILIVDVKAGRGAIIKDYDQAFELARELVWLGNSFGIKSAAIITDNDSPQGRYVGNLLAVAEIVQVLKGQGEQDITQASVALSTQALLLRNPSMCLNDAKQEVKKVMLNGQALDEFRSMVQRQRGNTAYVDTLQMCFQSRRLMRVNSSSTGIVTSINADKVNEAIKPLIFEKRGAVESLRERRSGIRINRKPGCSVVKGDAVVTLFLGDLGSAEQAMQMLAEAIDVKQDIPLQAETILASVLPGEVEVVPREIEAAAVIAKDSDENGTRFLLQFNRHWSSYNLISGKMEANQDLSILGAALRKVEEELVVVRDEDFVLQAISSNPAGMVQYSKRERCYTRYYFSLYQIRFLGDRQEMLSHISSNDANRWVTEQEIMNHQTKDGYEISSFVPKVLSMFNCSLSSLPISFNAC